MHKIRSIQVVNVRWFNATAWYGLYLSRLLRQAGHETIVITLPDSAPFRKAVEWGLEPVALPMNSTNPKDLAYLYGDMARLVEKFRPHVVNCHRGESFVLWGILKKRGRYTLVRTRGDQRPPKNSLINRILHNRVADAIIATNSITARSFTEDLGTAPRRVHTILGGVDTNRFYPDNAAGSTKRDRLGIAHDEFVLGILGRLDPVKGHEILINAVGKAKKSRPDKKLRLICIGDEANLKNGDLNVMARKAGIAGNLLITGHVENVQEYLNALDLGVLTSIDSETIARAALEIMACQVPLLSSDVGVMPDLLPPDVLVPAGDEKALARALRECIDDPARLAHLRECATMAMSDLGPDDFLKKTLAVYENAAK